MTRTVLLAFACFALSIAPALAARIYNLTPLLVQVSGAGGGQVTLRGEGRSESLSWKTNEVTVRDERGKQVCKVDFGVFRNEVAGGQYMLIAYHGYRVNCSLCDGDGKLIKSATGEFGPAYAQVLGTKRSDKWSCP